MNILNTSKSMVNPVYLKGCFIFISYLIGCVYYTVVKTGASSVCNLFWGYAFY